jgi:hypothetical protein
MLTAAALLSTLVLIISSAFVGLRLLLLAKRTRALPEFLLGYALAVMACGGYPLAVLSQALDPDARRLALLAILLSSLAMASSWAFVFAFVYTVFRKGSTRFFAFACFGVAATVATGIMRVAYFLQFSRMADADHGSQAALAMTEVALIAYAWFGLESFRYFRMMKRRRAIGLGDPVLTNRFLLLTIVALTSLLAALPQVIVSLMGINPFESAAALALTSIGGTLSGVTLWLAFAPPRAYTSWLMRWTEATETTAAS